MNWGLSPTASLKWLHYSNRCKAAVLVCVILKIADMSPQQIWHQEISVALSLFSVSTGNSQLSIHHCSLAASVWHSQCISSPVFARGGWKCLDGMWETPPFSSSPLVLSASPKQTPIILNTTPTACVLLTVKNIYTVWALQWISYNHTVLLIIC